MSSNIIYKNKVEVFKCSLDIDGATSGDIKVRLCLEFNDNKNMFFYGQMDKNGNCTVSIPKLTELEDKQGKLRIEAIVDDTYFNLYECPVELKNSVQMKIKEGAGTFFNNSNSSGVRVQFERLEKEDQLHEKKKELEPEEVEEETKPKEKKPRPRPDLDPDISKKPLKKKEIEVPTKEEQDEEEDVPIQKVKPKGSKFRSFGQYMKEKN